MPRNRDAEISALLDDAVARGSCLAAQDESLARALRRRVQTGELVSPAPSLFARADLWQVLTPTQRTLFLARGLGELHPYWTFCGSTAAVIYGLSVPYPAQHHIEVLVPPGSHVRGSGPVLRRISAHAGAMRFNGMRVTSLPRTAFDCMRWLDFRQGLAIADSALRRVGKDAAWLQKYVRGMRDGYRGIERARETARHASPLAENGGESIARAAMHELGFATPELQARVDDPLSPGDHFRVDFHWPNGTHGEVIGELDGIDKVVDPVMTGPGGTVAALRAERLRESRLTLTHASVMRFHFNAVHDARGFSQLLDTFGVPRDHEPLIDVYGRALRTGRGQGSL